MTAVSPRLAVHPAVASQAARRARAVGPRGTTTYRMLFGVLAVLNLLGLVMVLSASSVVGLHREGSSWFYFSRQVMGVVGGMVLFVIAVSVDYRRWRRWAVWAYLGAVALLVSVLVPGVGVDANGSSRWVDLGPMQLQPSEFAKLAVLLLVADILARRQAWVRHADKVVVPAAFWTGIVAMLLMFQPNLGTTLVVGAIVMSMLYAAGVPGRHIGLLVVVAAAGATFATLFTPYRRARFFAFLDPWADAGHTGYQNVQAQVSLGSGGWLGVGLGEGTQKWGFLPEAHTDFIFAIIGEELGLLGALLVVVLFAALGVFGLRTALDAPDTYGRLVATGITTWFCVQGFVNIGAVIGILPITGIPLPFVSFGSSAMLANMAAAGILCNICRTSRSVAPAAGP
jgi:cell division protein FtsW